MSQIYLFIAALLAIIAIMTRRNIIFNATKRREFKKEVSQKVDELKKEEHSLPSERFKESFIKEQEGKKFDLKRHNEEIRKADMAIAKKQWNTAKKHLILAISFSKNEVPASLMLAKVYMESSDFKRAENLYVRLMESDIDNPEIYENLAKIYTHHKRYKDAVKHYVRAVELDERDDAKLFALGKLYFLMMRYSLAGECFRRAAELRPREAGYLFYLADACKKDEDFENAINAYEKILTMEPYNERAESEVRALRTKMKEEELLFQT
jgi:Flp pilus assembly protein TadD